MTDFRIEDEKVAIKTKPSYPGCRCEQQASPVAPAPSRFIILRMLGDGGFTGGTWAYSFRGKTGTRHPAGRTWGGGAAGFPLLASCSIIRLAARTHQLEVIVGVMRAPGGTRPALDSCMGKRDQCLCTTSDPS